MQVIDHFNEALEKAQLEEWSPDTVLEVIKRRSLTWKPEILTVSSSLVCVLIDLLAVYTFAIQIRARRES